jgi:hypothetical protein
MTGSFGCMVRNPNVTPFLLLKEKSSHFLLLTLQSSVLREIPLIVEPIDRKSDGIFGIGSTVSMASSFSLYAFHITVRDPDVS